MDDIEKIEEETIMDYEEQEEASSDNRHPLLITLLVGLAMLLVGFLLGYVGRGQFGPEC